MSCTYTFNCAHCGTLITRQPKQGQPRDTFCDRVCARRGKAVPVYRKLHDGEAVLLADGLMQLACCDCGLVHVVKVERTRAGIVFRAWRHRKATTAKRRARARAKK